jgi:ABC-type transport system substrate-binding protein
VIGGYTAERVALRRAIALAFDHQASIDIAMYGAGARPHGVVPPGVAGYDAAIRTDVYTQDLPRALALLDTYGYVDRDGDGWREDPLGRPLSLRILTAPEPRFVPWDELYTKAFARLGIRLDIKKLHSTEITHLQQLGKSQITFDAWNMDFPDAEDFYVILSGPAAGFANMSHFALPAYDALFEKTRRLRDSPERNALYRRMDKLIFAYMPIMNHLFLLRSAVSQPWLIGYIPHPVHLEPWKYLDVDMQARAAPVR